MTEDSVKRKLTAILCADVKGYSRLMGADEVGTFHTLSDFLEIMNTIIADHRGHVFSSPGDAILAQFRSVVDAVECAVEIQEKIEAKNVDIPEDRKMRFRIGVNLGDVIEKKEQIYGDGVNIAARIETLAEPGGVSISRNVYNNVKNKLKFGYEYQGEHQVKNIADPVRVYKVLTTPETAGQLIGETKAPKFLSKKPSIAIFAVLVIVAVSVIWYFYPRSPEIEPASIEKMAHPLPDKPSIAVLPFDNMSGDPEQEYFSDGMTDDLITDLSKISGLFIIARNSVFTYKGKPVKVQQVAEDLGVRYVLEGSIRKAGEKVRVNAQLIDATTGHHLWAERYDGKIGDVFTLQDKITRKIVSALAVTLTVGEQEKVVKMETDNIAAYEAFLKGWQHYRRWTRKDWNKAVVYFKKAIQLDPKYGRAYAALGTLYFWSIRTDWALDDLPAHEYHKQGKKYLQLAMNNPTSQAHWLASQINMRYGQHEKAIAEAERAIDMEPNEPENHVQMSYSLIMAGRPEEAIDFLKRAMRLDPHYPAYYLFVFGIAHFALGEYEEAVSLLERAYTRNPEFNRPLLFLAAAYAHLEREQKAREALYELTKGVVRLSAVMYRWPFKDTEVSDRLAEGLRKAGMPE